LPDDGILVSDTGHAGIWTGSMIDLRPGQSFLRCAGSLGWAFPASLGAKCAQPDRSVVCFTGDGGLYYHLAELETAARYGINAVIVVNNNRSLSQDKKVFRSAWDGSTRGDPMWVFQDIDLARVAADLGCASFRVTSASEIGSALQAGLEMDRPVVIDVVTDIGAFPDPPFGGRDFYDAVP
jgi:acetolactate synthase-1/2/3 large subunit